MIAAERTALVLLAAGQSQRFGDADKLMMPWRGMPLGLHAVAALAAVPFAARVAVVSATQLEFASAGYRVVANDDPAAGLSRSLRLGVEAVMADDIDAAMVALADMPCVTVGLVRELLAAGEGAASVVAAGDGSRPSPPALFGRSHFAALCRGRGDEGARALIRTGTHIAAEPGELIDIDTREDYDRLTRA